MFIELDEKVAEKALELANSQGLSLDECVSKIVEWYIQDCEKEN